MLRMLYAHQAWADATILAAVSKQPGAMEDEAMRKMLHHIVMVQRAFLSLFQQTPFDMAKENALPVSVELFRQSHEAELAFAQGVDEGQLARTFEMPWIPGLRLSVGEAMMQVVMHSQSHRGQCAARLRALGGAPPMTDFIIWLRDRPTPMW